MKRFSYVEEGGERLYVECEDNTTPPGYVAAHRGQVLRLFYMEERKA